MNSLPLFTATLSGLLFAAAFPSFNISYLAWVSLVPLLLLTKSEKRFNPLTLGLLSGFVANLVLFSWLLTTFRAAGIALPISLFCWMALSAILALYFGLFTSFYAQCPASWMKPWLAGAMWVALEHIRSYLLSGFPWALLGHTQAYNPLLRQTAAVTGVAGISFLLVVSNSTITELWSWLREKPFNRHRETSLILSSTFFLVLLLGAGLFGWGRLHRWEKHPKTFFTVALLQGNIDQYKKWDAVYEADIRATYSDLALKAALAKPDLIVWPESAVPGWIPNDRAYTEWLQTLVKKTGTPNFVGAVSSIGRHDFNSAFLIGADGTIFNHYDKIHLVPFGEFNPFGNFLNKIIPYLGQLGTFSAGKGPSLFYVERGAEAFGRSDFGSPPRRANRERSPNASAPLAGADGGQEGSDSAPSLLSRSTRPSLPSSTGQEPGEMISIAPNICYEAIFGPLVRKSVKKGADIIVNLTNDGWYLKTAAPEQHYVSNIFRAIENGRPVIRAANTGISAIIDPTGNEIVRTKLMVTGVHIDRVPLATPPLQTPYLKWGDWFIFLCWAMLILFFLSHVKFPHKQEE